jgi:hypothetical protein
LPPAARKAVLDHVATRPGTEVVFMAESGTEHGFGVEITLASNGAADDGVVAALQAIVNEHMGKAARILWLRSAPTLR